MNDTPLFQIQQLSPEHVIDAFDCGEHGLNEYLIRFARWNASAGIGKTYVIAREDEPMVLGYYTLAVGQLRTRDLPERVARRLPKYPVPIIKIGRLASDRSVRGQGVGEALLLDALFRAARIAEQIAVFAVEVDALNERARGFYLRYGFEPLLDDRMHLYLSIRSIQNLL
jgi:GNAT superfamily N-acetyltransferase